MIVANHDVKKWRSLGRNAASVENAHNSSGICAEGRCFFQAIAKMQKTYSEPELEWLKLVCIYLIGSYMFAR